MRIKIWERIIIVSILLCAVPAISLAQTQPKTFTGTVTKIVGSQVFFRTTNAANYSAEVGNAQLVRKNGAAMKFTEILPGDKIETKGILWADSSISATYLRNLSLFPHTGTFSGKIIYINPANSSFVIDGKTNGAQTINTDQLTTFKKNKGAATFSDMQLGMTASVKGLWDRNKADIAAKSVEGTLRYINITITGAITMKIGNSFTVLGSGNAIYGIDVTNAKLQNKNGQSLPFAKFNTGDVVKVEGKHLSGDVAITATLVKNTSVK